jgi:hypothetical protein
MEKGRVKRTEFEVIEKDHKTRSRESFFSRSRGREVIPTLSEQDKKTLKESGVVVVLPKR